MKVKRIVFLVTVSAACIWFWLSWNKAPQVKETVTPETVEESSSSDELAIEEPALVDPLHVEVIAEAESAGLSDDQLKSIKNNADKIAQMVRVFSYPIELYGKVVDLEGNPIADAKVKQSFTGKGCDCPEYLTTDENGEFYLSGKGSSVFIRTSKEGYYETEQSKGTIGYTIPSDRLPADDPNNPAVFKLRKHGEAEYLKKYEFIENIPRNGEFVGFDLISGRRTSASNGHIVVRACSPDEKRGAKGEHITYAWRFEIIAPEGGFIERVDQFDFIAPKSGYTEILTFEMSADADIAKWKRGVKQEVFAKLNDGNYARLIFHYGSKRGKAGDYLRIESYTNPSGSRNLEYDPSLEINSQ